MLDVGAIIIIVNSKCNYNLNHNKSCREAVDLQTCDII